jgi:hypothetical protein
MSVFRKLLSKNNTPKSVTNFYTEAPVLYGYPELKLSLGFISGCQHLVFFYLNIEGWKVTSFFSAYFE